jgi:hypothetical protein
VFEGAVKDEGLTGLQRLQVELVSRKLTRSVPQAPRSRFHHADGENGLPTRGHIHVYLVYPGT